MNIHRELARAQRHQQELTLRIARLERKTTGLKRTVEKVDRDEQSLGRWLNLRMAEGTGTGTGTGPVDLPTTYPGGMYR